MESALFLFAHQDDEYAAAPWIAQERAGGTRIACLYLTDGGNRTAPGVRDAESRNALRELGIPPESACFLSDANGRIGDGALAREALRGLALVEEWLRHADFAATRIYAPSYEGGHPDHDAAHLIAAAIAAERGLVAGAWHFSLYNAYRCPRPFFHAFRQLPTAAPARGASLPPAQRRTALLLFRHYPSQWRTWAGLIPGALLERGILRRETVVNFDLARLRSRPHDGPLLYERMFGTTYPQFAQLVAPLAQRLAS